MKRTSFNSFVPVAVAAALCFGLLAAFAHAAPCCTSVVSSGREYRLEYSTVSEPVEHTSYKKVVETQFIEEEITSYQTVWETQQRERRYTVARQVPETSMQERRYTVNRPVEETEYRDTSYNVTRYVQETSEREERYLVSKQVFETQQREVVENRRVPVQETSIEDRLYTVNRPVTTLASQTVDRGGFVDSVSAVPGRTYHRLAWQRGGEYYDPVSGAMRWRVPGLRWTPMHGEDRYSVSRVYQPNYVTETVPVTTTVQEQRIEQVPVTRTTYRDERVARVETVQVPRTVQEEVVRKIPVTTYKPVIERVQQTTPVKVRRVVTEEKIEEVPVTTYKTVLEERVEPYEVKVARVVPVKQVVRKPVKVEKWVPYTYTVERKRIVVNKIPIESEPVIVSRTVIEPTPVISERIVDPVVNQVVETTDRVGIAKPNAAPGKSDEILPSSGSTYQKDTQDDKDPSDSVPVIDN